MDTSIWIAGSLVIAVASLPTIVRIARVSKKILHPPRRNNGDKGEDGKKSERNVV